MRVHAHIPIGEIAASLPQTTKLFDVIGIDYICHGDLSLRDACAEAGVDPAIVRKAIESMPRSEADRPSWSDASMQGLLDELCDRRHPLLRRMLGHTATLLAEAPPTAEMMQLRLAFTARTARCAAVREVLVTDSVPQDHAWPKLRVVSVATLLASAIRHIASLHEPAMV
ncbi:MAG TPA: DUF542 domain-containing protein [Thermoanaerobaculia bacterium]|nr:DUF542 domain-containing protein [Thermoanaerobaculia bacterium]